METNHLVTTRELAATRGVSRQAIAQAVRRGTLVPAMKLSSGAYLFEAEQPDAEADEQ